MSGRNDTDIGINRAFAREAAKITKIADTPAACISVIANCPGKPQIPAVEDSAMPRVKPLSLASDPNPVMLAINMMTGKPNASFNASRVTDDASPYSNFLVSFILTQCCRNGFKTSFGCAVLPRILVLLAHRQSFQVESHRLRFLNLLVLLGV